MFTPGRTFEASEIPGLPSAHGVERGPVELDAITVHGGHGGIEFPDIARFDARHPEAVRCHVVKGGGG